MRQQLTTDGSFSEAEAMRLVRGLGAELRSSQPRRAETGLPPRRAVIARTVEDEVIPRLLKACETLQPTTLAPHPAKTGAAVTPEDVADLTEILLTGTQPETAAFVGQMQECGVAEESLLLNLLTPAARKLGAMWVDDDCSFADVTVGMLRLANVMRVVGSAFEAEAPPITSGPRALLVQMPGEQHGFGIAIVASFFRKAGWNVTSEPIADAAALIGLVQRQWFSLVGLSCACTDQIDRLAATIRAIRAASRNPDIGIMVGGFAFIENPQLTQWVGADCTATDARLAVQQANALVSQRACAT